MRALVVDDSRTMRSILRHTLEKLGFDVVEAENGRVALERIEQIEKPELALVDWNMPEMNGLDFVRAVRADDAYDGVLLMMVTTETDPNKIAAAMNAGANDFVTKPFTKEEIRHALVLHGLVSA